MARRHASSGLTLLELLIALAIGGVLLVIAVPSYRAWVADLEMRVRILEAKVRELRSGAKKEKPSLRESAAATRATRRTRSLPRCPGCTLEQPAGRRGESCVWCGFRFDAVGGRTL
jgi:prepilin-type N-terminal cleavage/methylation domain-containing protein